MAAALVAALAASGCDDGAPAENVTRIKVANPHHDQLRALSEPMRRLALFRAVRDSGKRCKRVEAGRYQEDHRGLAMWVALCDDGRQWAVFIAPNADIQVRACTEAAALDLPQCRPVAAPAPTVPPPG